MFSILDGINRLLSFLNFNSKFKNKLYTFLGIFTTSYIGYLAWNFFKNQAYGRGALYLVIFLVLLYFWLLNFLYYFTDRSVKWDISPLFEKYIVEHEGEKEPAPLKAGKYGEQLVIFDQEEENAFLPTFEATAILTKEGQEFVYQIADFMAEENLVVGDFDGVTEKKCTEKTYQFPEGIPIPSTTLEEKEGKLMLLGGLNAMDRRIIATISKVADQNVQSLIKSYQLKPSHVKITGGNYMMPGRSGLIHGKEPYHIKLDVICLNKD